MDDYKLQGNTLCPIIDRTLGRYVLNTVSGEIITGNPDSCLCGVSAGLTKPPCDYVDYGVVGRSELYSSTGNSNYLFFGCKCCEQEMLKEIPLSPQAKTF